MFTPSLASVMFHALWRESPEQLQPERIETTAALAREITNLLNRLPAGRRATLPTVPVVARIGRSSQRLFSVFGRNFTETARGSSAWGHIELSRLGEYFSQQWEVSASDEILDLATPFQGSTVDLDTDDSIDIRCAELLSQTCSDAEAEIIVGFVDRGVHSQGNPENYGGKLRHLISAYCAMAPHAKQVLEVLLRRLARHSILHKAHIVCALVLPQKNSLGDSWDDQANSVEIIKSLSMMSDYLRNKSIPASINLSLGTHVGPHNGESPLEKAVSSLISPSQHRYVHVAVGNDGLRGHHASCILSKDIADTLVLQTGPQGSENLLVETWWNERQNNPLSVGVNVLRAGGQPRFLKDIQIDSQRANIRFSKAVPTESDLSLMSLYASRCYNTMSCCSFMLTATNSIELANLRINITLESAVDEFVNSWIVTCSDLATTFVGANRIGTVTVPSTADDVVSVAGIGPDGRPWPDSSRGPTAMYTLPSGPLLLSYKLCPQLSHISYLDSEKTWGTSIASANACADTAAILADPILRTKCTDTEALVRMILGSNYRDRWDNRIGFGYPPL